MRYELFIGLRYLRAKRTRGLHLADHRHLDARRGDRRA